MPVLQVPPFDRSATFEDRRQGEANSKHGVAALLSVAVLRYAVPIDAAYCRVGKHDLACAIGTWTQHLTLPQAGSGGRIGKQQLHIRPAT